MTVKTAHSFSVKQSDGKEISLADYRGKVLLIVNTASQCGFTPQYAELQSLYDHYQKRGFSILAFPCNQFGRQEPGTNEEIQRFCDVNYHITFPVFGKILVNGKNSDPLFRFLKNKKPGFLGIPMIKWNFTKFLVDTEGTVVKRYSPMTSPTTIKPDIENVLKD